MIRSFIFKGGKLMGSDLTPDMLRLLLYDDDVQLWVDMEAPSAEEARQILETTFSFHPLAVEDCLQPSDRPKVDEYEHYIFMTIHAVDFASHSFKTTEIDFFIGRNFLVTYHEQPLMSVHATVDRIRKNQAAVARAPDRLTYTLLDFLLDNYEPALSDLSVDIAALEKDVVSSSTQDFIRSFQEMKNEVQHLRQIIFPQREVIARIARGEFKIVRAHMLPYYRDLLDRLVRINALADNYRDAITNSVQLQLNIQQMHTNNVIKALTVLATLLLPLLVVTSFYGMNVHHFPDATWSIGSAYGWVFGITLLATGAIYWILKRQRWL